MAYPNITVAGAPHALPAPGDLWWSTLSGQLFVSYNDGNSQQWVVANRDGPPNGLIGPEGPMGPAGAPGTGFLNVVSYGVSMNGVTESTAAATAAVAAAAAAGLPLYWPAGTAFTSASIPLLHTIQNIGPGRIKRGVNIFYVQPKPVVGTGTTNHLYVAPGGTTTNDGLSPSEPTTAPTAVAALRNYGPVLQGTWQIDFAAGDNAGFLVTAVLSANPVRFIGVPTGDFRSVPTSKITKAASGATLNGMVFTSYMKVFVKDLLVSGFTDTDRSGVRASDYVTLTLENVHTDNCYHGWYLLNFTIYNAKGGTISNCLRYGVNELFTVIRNFKYAGSSADRTIIVGCLFGAHCKELCTGHFDFAEVTDCTYGIMLARESTMNPADMIFARCYIGVALSGDSKMVHATDINWNAGTVDACTIQVLVLGPQLLENVTGGGNIEDEITAPFVGQTLKTFGYGIVPVPHTGTVANTILINSLGTLRAGEFQAENTQVRCKAFGTCSLVAGSAILYWRVGGVAITSFTLPIGAVIWEFKVHYFVNVTGNSQRFFGKLTYSTATSTAPAVVLLNSTTRANDHKAVAYTLNLTAALAVATDSITPNFAETWTTNR